MMMRYRLRHLQKYKYKLLVLLGALTMFSYLLFVKMGTDELVGERTENEISKSGGGGATEAPILENVRTSDLPEKLDSFPEVPPVQTRFVRFAIVPKSCLRETPEILVVVHSSSKNFRNREILRRTLGRLSKYEGMTTRLIFVTALDRSASTNQKMRNESRKNDDLLIVNIPDKYTLMTYKAIGWIKWMVQSCPKVERVIKIDDDTFLNMFGIARLLKKCREDANRTMCHRMGCLLFKGFKPHRGESKYRVDVSGYSRTDYPDFCPGVAIFIPGSLVPRLLEASKNVQYLWLDDVYLTGLLIEYLREDLVDLGDIIQNTLSKDYNQLVSGKYLVGHFKQDVANGVYEKFWNKIEKVERSRGKTTK